MQDVVADPAADASATLPSDPFAGRYQLTRTLKSGNGVDTFLAVDIRNGRHVVVKSIDPGIVHAAARPASMRRRYCAS